VSPCERKNIKLSSSPSKLGALGESATYLKLEKPRFLFLEGSGGAATALVAAATALTDAPAALTDAPTAHAASSTNHSVLGTPAPATGARSSTTSAALSDGGEGFHLSVGPAPRRSPLPPPPPMNSPESSRGSPCCSRSWYSSLSCSRRFRCWILLSFLHAARSCSHRCAARAAARARGVGGSDRAASTVTLC
jgi:hypothetical protein